MEAVLPVPDPSTIRRRRAWLLAALPPAAAFVLLVLVPVLPRPRAESAATVHPDVAFLTARLAMAEENEPGVSLDAAAGFVVLEQQGVMLRTAPLRAVRADRAAVAALRDSVDVPARFTLQRAAATIPKAPVRVVEAPRDTVEAQRRPRVETRAETDAVYVVLVFDRGLAVVLVPAEADAWEAARGRLLLLAEDVRAAGRTVAAVAQGRRPTPRRRVVVTLDPADARALYRALPEGASWAVRL